MHLQLDHMLPHWNFLRKTASDFGWDWGPAFAPSGIYGGVQLKAYSAAHMTGLLPCLAQTGVSGFAGGLKAAGLHACQACCQLSASHHLMPPGSMSCSAVDPATAPRCACRLGWVDPCSTWPWLALPVRSDSSPTCCLAVS